MDIIFSSVVLAILSNIVPSHGQTGTQAKALYTQLFVNDSYNLRIRPATNQSQATVVTVDLLLSALNEVNTVQGTLKITGYLQIKWRDDFLQWIPSSYGSLQEYHWPQKEVWKPDISLANSFLDFDGFGSDYVLVKNQHNGSMTWTPFEVFISTCSLDVTKFPFDTQTCRLKFASWSYTRADVSLTGGELGFGLDDYEDNPEWTIVSRDWSLGDDPDDDVIIFVIKLRRNPAYVSLTVILPINVLSILNVLTFVIPGTDKIDFAVTLFLTLAVYFALIASILPESVAILTVYLILMAASSAMTCVIVVIQARCCELDGKGKQVPRILIYLTKRHGRKSNLERNKVDSDDHPDICKGEDLKSISESTVGTNQDEENAQPNDVTWQEAVELSDWVFFCAFGIFFILCTSIIFTLANV